jgi:coproporphyrinogen III oxidase-like Fe-S oxidoreductase
MLGLRLDQPLPLATLTETLDAQALDRMEALALVERSGLGRAATLRLTTRGRFVGDAVAAELIA